MLDLLFAIALFYALYPLEVGLAWCGLAFGLMKRYPFTVTWDV